jgi:hypothetical protein
MESAFATNVAILSRVPDEAYLSRATIPRIASGFFLVLRISLASGFFLVI